MRAPVRVHLLDGTYELFRHHFGRGDPGSGDRAATRAVRGVVASVISMVAGGATHLGAATDHVIESFRNDLWPGYKTGENVPAELLAQFGLLEEALVALGVVVWPMVELEADDALASAAATCADDPTVDQVVVCTPDKDLAQCVTGDRVVQLDRRSGTVTDEDGVWAKFGVAPASIPDWLALVGDSADGFPGIKGWGKRSASVALAHYGRIDAIPDREADWDPKVRAEVRGAARLATQLAGDRALAELFCLLATLRIEPGLLGGPEDLAWRGPTAEFEVVCRRLAAPELAERAGRLAPA